MKMGELALIERVRQAAGGPENRRVRLGIGDDCAILDPPRGHELLVTADFSLEGRHFRRDWHTAQSAGHRCLARGLSDIAAMGGRPMAAFLSLAVPTGFDPDWVDGFMAGLLRLAGQHGVTLAGGDTAEAPGREILADIVVVGSVRKGRALRRSGARVGDRIFVSGSLGGSAAELEAMALRGQGLRADSLAPAQNRQWDSRVVGGCPQTFPEPRLGLGRALVRRGLAMAAIDLSDGLSTDLTHLCRASGVGAEIEAARIPLHAMAGACLPLALHGGEDYELLFTVDAEAVVPKRLGGVRLTEIGRMVAGEEVRLLVDGQSEKLAPGGWEHFRS